MSCLAIAGSRVIKLWLKRGNRERDGILHVRAWLAKSAGQTRHLEQTRAEINVGGRQHDLRQHFFCYNGRRRRGDEHLYHVYRQEVRNTRRMKTHALGRWVVGSCELSFQEKCPNLQVRLGHIE